MAEVPWRARIGYGPQTVPLVFRFGFDELPLFAPGLLAVLPVNPGMTRTDQLCVQAHAIIGDDSNRSPVSIRVHWFHINRLPENRVGCELLGFLPVILVLLGAINAVKSDLFTLPIVHDGDGVAIAHTNHFSLPGPAEAWKDSE